MDPDRFAPKMLSVLRFEPGKIPKAGHETNLELKLSLWVGQGGLK